MRITEFMASNGSIIMDDKGEYDDWIELHNSGTLSINLEGYFLSDDLNDPFKWRFNQLLAVEPDEYIIIWADNENRDRHTSFSLNRQEEEIVLSDPDSVLVDSVKFYDQIYDYSYGRAADGSWGYFSEPTPGMENATSIVKGRCQAPILKNAPGTYEGFLKIELENVDPQAEIYYTRDGSVPTVESKHYDDKIQLFETGTVRARAFKEGWLPSRVVTGTYFINERIHDIDIVSVSTDPDNLWDDEYGIHVVGNNGIEKYGIVANYNQEWERPVSVELFKPYGKREFQVDAGMQISGQYSRKNEHKSLAFYLRGQYGFARLSYPLFPEKDTDQYNNFLLRNSGSEWPETMFGDAISQYVVKDQMDADFMAYRPAAVYLNGDYWGILNLREKINEHYPASNYDIPAEEVDMLESSGDYDYRIVSGDNSDYMALRSYVENNELSDQQSFEHVASRIDLEHYTDYQITEIYENNTDWPGNNIKYWRHRADPYSKWRWVMYDLDRGFSIRGQAPDYEKNGADNLVRALSSGKYNFLLTGMMNNAGYREYFIKRFNAHIYTTFHPERVNPIFDAWMKRLENEMENHLDKWGDNRWDWGPFDEKTIGGWRDIVDYKKYWAEERPAVMMGILKEYFGLSDTFRIDLSVSSLQHGHITVNGVKSTLKDFSGAFFSDYNLDISAHPYPGYHFDHWEGITFGNHTADYSLNIENNMEIKAVFSKNSLQINEIMADNINSLADDFGEYDDWIELYNSGNESVSIGGMYISDDPLNPLKWKIPASNHEKTTIQPGGYLVLWADADTTQGILHLGFKLDKNGETVILTSNDEKTLISSMDFGKQHHNKSYGDFPDGSLSRKYMPATPGTANATYSNEYDLFINEYMAANSTIMDEYNEFDDWIEIYNNGLEDVNLAGFYLTDDFSDPVKYQISDEDPYLTTIPSKGFLVIWADNDSEQGPLHTNFKLSAAGEELALTEPGGQFFIDSLVFANMTQNISRGRIEDGGNAWRNFADATPGRSNLISNIDLDVQTFIAAYPNPFKNNLTIHLKEEMIGENIEITIMDVYGRPVYLNEAHVSGDIDVNLSGIPAGVYFLRIISWGQLYTKTIIKQ